jgi:hypothetical protein
MTDQKRINQLEKNYAVLETKLDHVSESIKEIKTNHLVHINDQLKDLTGLINTKFDCSTQQITDIYKQINDLSITDARREPTWKLGSKVFEYIIIAVIGGLLAVVIKSQL